MRSDFIRRELCELCGNGTMTPVCSVDFLDGRVFPFLREYYRDLIPIDVLREARFEIAKCADCGFLWQTYVLGPGWSGTLYEEWIDADASLKKREAAGTGYRAKLADFTSRVGSLIGRPSGRMLDFGMGWGHWCATANASGMDAIGCEVSDRRIAYAASLGVRAVKDIRDLPDGSFSFINADQVFEHVERPRELLQGLVDKLRPGGLLHLAVPDGSGTEARFKKPWTAGKDACHPLEHINTFTRKTLERLGTSAGLRPIFVLPSRNPVLLDAGRRLPYRLFGRLANTNMYFEKSDA